MDLLYSKIIVIPAILLAFTFHEFAHAKVADMLGDKTPRFQGRLTLNPLKHIDPIGFICILLVGFGWAKPVETNPGAYKDPYKDDLKVSIAGPIANLILAFLGCLLFSIGMIIQFKMGNVLPKAITAVIIDMLYALFTINVYLFIFNILPIPGLDGFHILRDLKPNLFYKVSNVVTKYQTIIILVFLMFGGKILSIPANYIIRSIMKSVYSILALLV